MKAARAAKRALHDVLLLHSTLWIAWLYYAFVLAPSPPERDWFVLREVARSFVAGDWASLYADRVLASGLHFFRYPPFVLYLISPLAALPPNAAYAVVCVSQLAAAAGAFIALCRIRRPAELRLNIVGVLGSAALCHVIVSGQNSAVLTLVIAGAAACLASGRYAVAGACIGLLTCKPNWLPVFGAFVLWRGGWRAGVGMAMTVATLVLSTYPLGASVWQQFFEMTLRTGEIAGAYSAYREITLLAFLKSVFGLGSVTTILWLVCLGVLAGVGIRAVRDTRSLGRSMALITLLAVATNPYASFYDGFVLVVPGTLWLAHRDQYPLRAWWVIGCWIGAYWCWDMAVFYYQAVIPAFAAPGVSVGGLILTGWLTTEAVAVPVTEPAASPTVLDDAAPCWPLPART